MNTGSEKSVASPGAASASSSSQTAEINGLARDDAQLPRAEYHPPSQGAGAEEDEAPEAGRRSSNEPVEEGSTATHWPLQEEVRLVPSEGKGKGKAPGYRVPLPVASESEAGPSNAGPSEAHSGASPAMRDADGAQNGEIPWELDPERVPQKRPIRLIDALGRAYLIPWRRAKTWEAMKITIDQAFEEHPGQMSTHVVAGHYDLIITDPFQYDAPDPKRGFYQRGMSSLVFADVHSSPVQLRSTPVSSSTLVMPDFWEDFIRPGMTVNMVMWQHLDTPRYASIPMPPPPAIGTIDVRAARPKATRRGKALLNPGRPIRMR